VSPEKTGRINSLTKGDFDLERLSKRDYLIIRLSSKTVGAFSTEFLNITEEEKKIHCVIIGVR